MSQGWQSLLAPVGVWIHQRLSSASQQTIEQYYQDLSGPKLSNDLKEAVEALLGSQEHLRAIFKEDAVPDQDGILRWDEDNFRKWVASQQPLAVLGAFAPRLWHAFVYFAEFPFAEPMIRHSDAQDRRVNEGGFVQAYILLALRGMELLGNGKDGWTAKGAVENNWSQKAPRLLTCLFDGLKISTPAQEEPSQGFVNRDATAHAEEQLMDAIVLTQPVPHMTGLPFEEGLRDVAKRLLIDNLAPSYHKPPTWVVPKNDLQTLVQLILLLRLGNSPWKQGLVLHQTTRMSGDVERLALVTDEEEVRLSARLSDAFIKYKLGDADAVTRQAFETICAAYPNIVLRYYQLWTVICVPPDSAPQSQNLGSTMWNCVAQFLSLICPVDFDRPAPLGWHEDERQLQLDIQNATLVADSTSQAALDAESLVDDLSNDQQFHVLLITAEEVHNNAADAKSTEQLLALFTSPFDNQIPFWDCPGCPSYVWRYGLVQFLPHVITSPTGGLSANFQDGILRFSPHDDSYRSSSITVDLKSGIITIDWVDSLVLRLSLRSMKCYRMPGSAVKIHKSS
ncbi:hypothetical protein GQ53DRAFT_835549 [Thozetella sp. PMI_491]|nr:hypothetical protein GQ53DRAFT_835549 [Thozetella sp. PMI_491]